MSFPGAESVLHSCKGHSTPPPTLTHILFCGLAAPMGGLPSLCVGVLKAGPIDLFSQLALTSKAQTSFSCLPPGKRGAMIWGQKSGAPDRRLWTGLCRACVSREAEKGNFSKAVSKRSFKCCRQDMYSLTSMLFGEEGHVGCCR